MSLKLWMARQTIQKVIKPANQTSQSFSDLKVLPALNNIQVWRKHEDMGWGYDWTLIRRARCYEAWWSHNIDLLFTHLQVCPHIYRTPKVWCARITWHPCTFGKYQHSLFFHNWMSLTNLTSLEPIFIQWHNSSPISQNVCLGNIEPQRSLLRLRR